MVLTTNDLMASRFEGIRSYTKLYEAVPGAVQDLRAPIAVRGRRRNYPPERSLQFALRSIGCLFSACCVPSLSRSERSRKRPDETPRPLADPFIHTTTTSKLKKNLYYTRTMFCSSLRRREHFRSLPATLLAAPFPQWRGSCLSPPDWMKQENGHPMHPHVIPFSDAN